MSRNTNWTDNKVFGVGQQSNASNAGVMGFSYHEKQKQHVSPSTYSEPKAKNADVAGATYVEPNKHQNVAGATYAEANMHHGVAGVTHVESNIPQGVAGVTESNIPQGVAGATYAEPNKRQGVAGAVHTQPNVHQVVAGATHADPKTGVQAGTGQNLPMVQGATNLTIAQSAPLSLAELESMQMFSEQGPPPVTNPGYIPGYLKGLIGQPVRAEFLIGSNLLTDRTGIIREVGVNYFVLEDIVTRSRVMCDLYSVKFVTSL